MSTLELIQFTVIAVIAMILIVYYLIKAIKNHWLKELAETVNSAIRYAEDTFTGEDKSKKKAYVLNQVQRKCDELGIPYTLIYNLINKLINRVIKDYNVIKKGK